MMGFAKRPCAVMHSYKYPAFSSTDWMQHTGAASPLGKQAGQRSVLVAATGIRGIDSIAGVVNEVAKDDAADPTV